MLRIDNVKGSFNGSDIVTDYEGTPNVPENFAELFALHSAFTWEENLERLVEATNEIVSRNNRFQPSDDQREEPKLRQPVSRLRLLHRSLRLLRGTF